MQVCILYCGANQHTKLKSLADAIAIGVEKKGHQTTVLNALVDTDKRLTIYDYLVVLSEPISALSAKIPSYIVKYLENAGQVSGKRCACVISGGIRKNKALLNLMRDVESQGIIIKISEVIKREDEARAFGSHLNVERNY